MLPGPAAALAGATVAALAGAVAITLAAVPVSSTLAQVTSAAKVTAGQATKPVR
jgi:hypothetical protein